MLNLFDTLSKTLKHVDSKNRLVRLYSCGPTVYNHAHIGNLRSFVFADTIKRTLEANGQEVDWVMNITDVDDKTIKKTVEEFGDSASPKELSEFTDRYTKIFLNDLEELGIDTEQIRFIKVSEVIPQIQEFIIDLIDKGFAYKAEDGSTYFNIEKYQAEFGDYGKLVGEGFLAGKKVGARVAVDEYEKDNLSDFALWKAKHDDDAQIFWDHDVLGQGRPGWHIECSAINKLAFNGEPTDIHTGGVDLIFPHHTNEIAQSQPIYKPFVDIWSHSEFLLADNKKMAKRDGNFFTLDDLKQKYDNAGAALRYLFYQSDFRNQQNFTTLSFEAAISGLKRLKNSISELEDGNESEFQEFLEVLNQNLNTVEALPVLHKTKSKSAIFKINEVLGLGLDKSEEIKIPEEVKLLINQRQEARNNKDFTASDKLREQIEAHGFLISDSGTEQKISKK